MAEPTKTMLRPLHDRVLVKRLAEQDERHGRLVILDSAKEKPQEGRVVGVVPGRVTDEGKSVPLALKEGDRILFAKVERPSRRHPVASIAKEGLHVQAAPIQ
jgi:chaperonin GroES